MSAIYEPRGKAREYCELAVNLYHGCDHGCLYCYAPAATYKSREIFIRPRHRPGIIEQIQKDSCHAGMAGREVLFVLPAIRIAASLHNPISLAGQFRYYMKVVRR